jgi:site-specific recombinase XerD
MTSENTRKRGRQPSAVTSENRNATPPSSVDSHSAVLIRYADLLQTAPLAAQTRRTYLSKVGRYLHWLVTDAEVRGDPFSDPAARDWAVRDYRTHLLTVAKQAPATINNALAAIDDLYSRLGLGPAHADRLDLIRHAPRALTPRVALRWLRAMQAHTSTRDRVLLQLPFYAGLRVAETVGLDLDDVHLSARKGTLRINGKGERRREVPIHPQLRADLQLWLTERLDWPAATVNPALLLNRRGARLTTRAASDIFATVALAAGLEEDSITAHTARHTFATTLIRGGTDLIIVADLLGHARLETVRAYTRPTDADREHALQLLPTDR